MQPGQTGEGRNKRLFFISSKHSQNHKSCDKQDLKLHKEFRFFVFVVIFKYIYIIYNFKSIPQKVTTDPQQKAAQ